jgi:hypothetical protein
LTAYRFFENWTQLMDFMMRSQEMSPYAAQKTKTGIPDADTPPARAASHSLNGLADGPKAASRPGFSIHHLQSFQPLDQDPQREFLIHADWELPIIQQQLYGRV